MILLNIHLDISNFILFDEKDIGVRIVEISKLFMDYLSLYIKLFINIMHFIFISIILLNIKINLQLLYYFNLNLDNLLGK
jgi:hypothetical protein